MCGLNQPGACSRGHGAAPGPTHAARCQRPSRQSCPPPSQYESLLLVTLLSGGRHFSSTFASLQCCGLSTPVTRGGWAGGPVVTRSGVCLGTLGGRSQVEVFLVVSSGCRVLLRPDTCGGGRLVPEERQEGVVSSECHTGHRLGGKCTSQARRTQRPLPRALATGTFSYVCFSASQPWGLSFWAFGLK